MTYFYSGRTFKSSYPMGYERLNDDTTKCSDSPIGRFERLNDRKQLLKEFKKKQNFRVSAGLSKWIDYTGFDVKYNMREILDDEIVIEFDSDDLDFSWKGINFTAINLYNAGYGFEIWDHGGKSPHIHIHDLPIKGMEYEKRKLFKKIFIRKFVPKEYLREVDLSLIGTHMIAMEWAFHWKGKYSVKKLIYKFVPKETEVSNG